jgi:hypothetical protein
MSRARIRQRGRKRAIKLGHLSPKKRPGSYKMPSGKLRSSDLRKVMALLKPNWLTKLLTKKGK